MRCRWRSARAATPRWCATARTQGQVTAVFDVPRDHPARALLADNAIEDDGDIILRRVQTADGRTRAFVNDQPSSVSLMRDIGRALVEIHGQHDDRALVDAEAHRDLLDAFGGHDGDVDAVGRALAALARRRAGAARSTAPRSRRPRARPTTCAPRSRNWQARPAARRGGRACRARTAMMRAEKIAGDINEAQRGDRRQRLAAAAARRACCGGWSARRAKRRACSTRWSRRSTRRSIVARRGADRASRRRCAPPNSTRASWSAPRSGCLRCAPPSRKHQRAGRRSAGAARHDGRRPRRSRRRRGAARCAGSRPSRQREAAYDAARRAACPSCAAPAAAALEKAVMAELPALKLERARVHRRVASDADKPRGRRHRPGRVPGAHQPRHAARPADEGRFRRRAVALPAGAEGGARRPRLGADAGLRRDRYRRRRRRRRGDRPAAGAACRARAGAVRHACAAGRRAGRARTSSSPRPAAPTASQPASPRWIAPARQEEIARMLAGATITDEARAAADRLLSENPS